MLLWLLTSLFDETDLKENLKTIKNNYQNTRHIQDAYQNQIIDIVLFLPSNQSHLKGFVPRWGPTFLLYFLFSFDLLILLQVLFFTHILLLTASRHLIQEADITDGRAGHPHLWVLCTCCGSELHSVNRAPQSVDCPPSYSCTLKLGDDDLMKLVQ